MKPIASLSNYGTLAYRVFQKNIPYIDCKKANCIIVGGYEDGTIKVIYLG